MPSDNKDNIWVGTFGDEYSDRNDSIEEYEFRYKRDTGQTQEEIFNRFFENFDKDISILEVGCNRGLKLLMLKKMGFKDISGIEMNQKAYELAKNANPSAKIFHSNIQNFDSNPNQYDLVFTSTLLIHIPPESLQLVISKIVDLSRKYIFGLEFYSDKLVEVPYRGLPKALWKQDFPSIYRKTKPSLKLVKQEIIPYLNSDLKDVAFLLQKT